MLQFILKFTLTVVNTKSIHKYNNDVPYVLSLTLLHCFYVVKQSICPELDAVLVKNAKLQEQITTENEDSLYGYARVCSCNLGHTLQ